MKRMIFGIALLLLSTAVYSQTPAGGYVSPSGGGVGLTVITKIPATCTSGAQFSYQGLVLVCGANNVLTESGVAPFHSTPLADINLMEGSGNTSADLSGNGKTLTGISSACTNGTVTWGASPSFGLVYTNANCPVTIPLNTTVKSIEILFNVTPQPNYSGDLNGLNNGWVPTLIGGTVGANNVTVALSYNSPTSGKQVGGVGIYPFGGAPAGSNTADIPNGTQMLTVEMDNAADVLYGNNQLYTNYVANAAGHSGQSVTAMTGSWQFGGSAASFASSIQAFTGTIYRIILFGDEPTAAQQAADFQAISAHAQHRGITIGPTQTSPTCFVGATGDSITAGNGITTPYTGAVSLSYPCTIYNTGQPNGYAQAASTSNFGSLLSYAYPNATQNYITEFYGTNDLKSGATPEQVINYLLTMCRQAKVAGIQMAVGTILAGNGNADTIRDLANTQIRTRGLATAGAPTGCADLIDYAAIVDLGADGAGNGAGFQGDHTHPTQASYTNEVGPTFSAHMKRLISQPTTAGFPNVYKVGNAATPHEMEPLFIDPVQTTAGATFTGIYPVKVSSGSNLTVAFKYFSASSATVNSVTDTSGDTCTAAAAAASWLGEPFKIYTCPNSGGGAETVTVTLSDANGASDIIMWLAEDEGVATAAPVDVITVFQAATGTLVGPTTITTVTANDFLRTFSLNDTGPPAAVPSPLSNATVGWNQTHNYIPQAPLAQFFSAQTLPVHTAGAYTCGTQFSASTQYGFQCLGLKPGTIGATYNLSPEDINVGCDPSGGALQLNLYDAIMLTGENVTVRNIGTSGTNLCKLGTNSLLSAGQTVNGAATIVIPPNTTETCVSTLISASAAGANWTCSQSDNTNITPCVSAASAAVCGAAPTGSVNILTNGTSIVVNTTAVTANSQILVVEDESLGTRLGVTCSTQAVLTTGSPFVSARTPGTSFTIAVQAADAAHPICLSYSIKN